MISDFFWTFTRKVPGDDYTSGAGEVAGSTPDDVADYVAKHYELETGDTITVTDHTSAKSKYVVKTMAYAEKIRGS